MKSGKLFKPLLMILVISIIGLFLVEMAARRLFPRAVPVRLKVQFAAEGSVLHILRPDAMFHHAGEGKFHLNFPSHSDSAVPRIMIVGDSFAMAEGVRQSQRFGSLLQTNLGSRALVDVLAASSYSPVIYRNIVRTALATNSYRAVIVFVDQTDPADDLIYQDDLLNDGSWRFDFDKMTNRNALVEKAYDAALEQFSGLMSLRHFAIYNILKPPSVTGAFSPGDRHYHYVAVAAARTKLIQTFVQEPAAGESRQMETLLTAHLDQILAMCQQQKVPLFLAANPWEAMCSPDPKKGVRFHAPFPIDNRLERLLKERYAGTNGVYVIPLTPAFRGETNPSDLFLNTVTEIHWNKEGHQVAERTLRKELISKLPGIFTPSTPQ